MFSKRLQIGEDGGISRIGRMVFGGTAGSILFVDENGNLGQENAGLVWDTVNKRIVVNDDVANVNTHIYDDRVVFTRTTDGSEAANVIFSNPELSIRSFGGTGKVTIWDSTGEVVDITSGNVTMAGNLQVDGTFSTDGLFRVAQIADDGADLTLTTLGSTRDIIFKANAVEFMRIDTSDNSLLIGGTNPTNADVKIAKDGTAIFNQQGNDADFRIEGDTDQNLVTVDASTESVAIGVALGSHIGKFHVNQSSATGAKPVITLGQSDVSEEFLRLIGTSTTDATQSLVDAADMTTPGSIQGWFKVYIQDDQSTNPITDGVYYVPFYSAPTA